MVGVVLMMMNYEGGGVVVLWWLVSGGKSPFECGSSGTNGRMEFLLFFCFSFLAGKIAYSHEIFWGFAEESSHRGIWGNV
jgi:hypothetical protein